MFSIKKLLSTIFLMLLITLLRTGPAEAGSEMYQRCRPSTDCVIGEYVFDNTGSPIISQICTIDIRDPDGTLIVNDGTMTPKSDGWHYYTANIDSPEGFYRALMYCDNSGDTGYLDKSFILGSSFEDTGSDVWGHSSRTLSNFGDLAADIWNRLTSAITTTSSIGKLIVDNLNASVSSTATQTSIDDLEDGVDSLNTLVSINRQLLEKVANAPQIKVWYEKGSIFLKAEIRNPSNSITQKVEFEEKLPREVKPEHIINSDGLEVNYDSSEETYYLYGEFELAPQEMITKSVEIKNVWAISESEIENLKNNASQAINFLKGSPYFAQGSMLANDVNTRLNTIKEKQDEAITPEEHITIYRENLANLEIAKKNFETLNNLVLAWEGEKKVIANVGGIQITSTWGIILAVIVGLGLLGLTNLYYLGLKGKLSVPTAVLPTSAQPSPSPSRAIPKKIKIPFLALLATLVLLATILLALVALGLTG
jgi:hypothetical protein